MSNVNLSATLTLSGGVAVGILSPSNCVVNPLTGAKIVSVGTAQNPNEIVSYQNVQEGGGYAPDNGFILLNSGSDATRSFNFQFTDFSIGQGNAGNIFSSSSGIVYQAITFRDCQLHDSSVQVNASNPTHAATIGLTNNLILRGNVAISSVGTSPFNCYNNLFWKGKVSSFEYGTVTWNIKNNLFDGAGQSATYNPLPPYFINPYSLSNNGFTTGTTNSLGGSNNITNIIADYQVGPFGAYYYPSNGGNLSQLIDAGSESVSAAGVDGIYRSDQLISRCQYGGHRLSLLHTFLHRLLTTIHTNNHVQTTLTIFILDMMDPR